MPTDKDELIEYLKKSNDQQSKVIDSLNKTIEGLEATIANLKETIDELKRKLFGTSSETIKGTTSTDDEKLLLAKRSL